jgi:hypothetical protein
VSGGCRCPATKGSAIEPISPELVLVDPELAARVRSLEPAPLWVPVPRPAAPAPSPVLAIAQPPHRLSKRRAYLAVAWAAAVLSPVAAFANVRQGGHDNVTTAGEPLAVDRAIERILPPAVPGAIAAHPGLRAVIDPRTGLVRTGTTITCRVRYVDAFWCTLRGSHGRRVTVPVLRTGAGVTIVHG